MIWLLEICVGTFQQSSWLHQYYIIKHIMEQGNTHNEESLAGISWMHEDIQDMRHGLKEFEEIRVKWRTWAKEVLEQQERGAHTHRLPPSTEPTE